MSNLRMHLDRKKDASYHKKTTSGYQAYSFARVPAQADLLLHEHQNKHALC
jgi:hypothetical protein